MHDALLLWLLDQDPALRWQVERDLANEPDEVWHATRARVATEGFGARLLALQDPDGQWAGGAYFPGDFDFEGPEARDDAGQPYTATTWSLKTLREWGLDASALAGTAELLAANSRWEYDNLPYWGGEVDCCINAFTLANGAWLGADVAGLVDWFYNVLHAAEYFRVAALHHQTPPDSRMADAIERIREQRQPDGTWLQARRHPGRVWFEVDVPGGEPSPWLTLSATRVLRWWDER